MLLVSMQQGAGELGHSIIIIIIIVVWLAAAGRGGGGSVGLAAVAAAEYQRDSRNLVRWTGVK